MENDSQRVTVERDVEVAAPVEHVWERITDSTMVTEWMGGEVDIEPSPGGDITFLPRGGPAVWGTVEEVIVGRRIQWSWRTDDGLPSLIEIELSPGASDGSTRVLVRETLLPWTISGPDGHTEWPMASARTNVQLAA